MNVNVRTKIRVNSKEYSSPDEMPPEIRQAYERAMAQAAAGQDAMSVRSTALKVVFNGQEYHSVDEMPAVVRRVYESAMAAASQVNDNVPDAVQGTAPLQTQSPNVSASISPVLGGVGTSPESTGPRLLIAVGGALLLLALWALSHGGLWP